jgi:uncharacterized metal-binding protein YceD (DUF177 family)
MTPEFPRPLRVETIGEETRAVTVEADAGEREALAERFGLMSIERLEGRFTVHRDLAGIAVAGRVTAAVTQRCSITGDPIDAAVDEDVQLRFVEEAAVGEEEIELDEEAIDVLPVEDGAIDLGEAAAETLALSLDPFPRGPNAAAALAEAGVIPEEEARPFSAFAGLKDKLAGKL